MPEAANVVPFPEGVDPDIPAPPGDLKPRGAAFWTETVEEFELEAHKLLLLHEACRTLDTIDRFTEVFASESATVKGSMGQVVIHPAAAEARQYRLALVRILSALGLPEDEDESGALLSQRQIRNRKNAAKRGR